MTKSVSQSVCLSVSLSVCLAVCRRLSSWSGIHDLVLNWCLLLLRIFPFFPCMSNAIRCSLLSTYLVLWCSSRLCYRSSTSLVRLSHFINKLLLLLVIMYTIPSTLLSTHNHLYADDTQFFISLFIFIKYRHVDRKQRTCRL